MAPADVTENDVTRLWKLLYEPSQIIKKIKVPPKRSRFKFNVGDPVRVSALQRTFEQEYDGRYTRELLWLQIERYLKVNPSVNSKTTTAKILSAVFTKPK